jgi:hypothetical protein
MASDGGYYNPQVESSSPTVDDIKKKKKKAHAGAFFQEIARKTAADEKKKAAKTQSVDRIQQVQERIERQAEERIGLQTTALLAKQSEEEARLQQANAKDGERIVIEAIRLQKKEEQDPLDQSNKKDMLKKAHKRLDSIEQEALIKQEEKLRLKEEKEEKARLKKEAAAPAQAQNEPDLEDREKARKKATRKLETRRDEVEEEFDRLLRDVKGNHEDKGHEKLAKNYQDYATDIEQILKETLDDEGEDSKSYKKLEKNHRAMEKTRAKYEMEFDKAIAIDKR